MPASPRGLAGAKDAELAARREREAGEANSDFLHPSDLVDSDGGGEDDEDEDESEVTTRVFELELGGGSSPFATAFLECASEGDVTTLTRLLDEGQVEINDVDVDGFTALMIAAAEAQHDVAMELLRRGADVSIRTHEMRSTALHFAAKSGAAQVVEAICAQDPQRVDAQNLDGDTPLVWACTEGRVDAARVLLAHNANVNVVSHRAMSVLICAVMLRESDDSDNGDLEEIAATDADRAEIVKMLLTKNPKLVNYQDRDGSTAMHLAASHGYLKCVKALLEFGADITLRNAIGQTPLEEAEETGIKTRGGECIVYLRMMWKRLEEEASARMMAMLEMEEESTASSTAAPRSAKKASKKKQKKAKQRRASKTIATTSATQEKVADGKAVASSDEGSSDEEIERNETKDQPAEQRESVPEELNHDEGVGVPHQGENEEEHKSDVSHDGGVWTTVGRKHNHYLSQRAAAVPVPDNTVETSTVPSEKGIQDADLAGSTTTKIFPAGQRTKHSATSMSATVVSATGSSSATQPRSREDLRERKIAPAKPNLEHAQPDESYSADAQPVQPMVCPRSSSSTVSHVPPASTPNEVLSVNSPFSTFQRLHNSSRLYERHENRTEILSGSAGHSRATHDGSIYSTDVPSLWRASSASRSLQSPFTLPSNMSVPSISTTPQGGQSNAQSSSAIWKYASPASFQHYDRGISSSSKRQAPTHHLNPKSQHSASNPILRSLSCGLCGEIVNDNVQCHNLLRTHRDMSSSTDGNPGESGDGSKQCFQLYCAACLARATGSGPIGSIQCIKCGLPLHPRQMERNMFAQEQADTAALASRAKDTRHQLTHQYQLDPYDQMRALLRQTSERVKEADVDPFYLVPGANLAAMSVGQLDALEELHLAALQQITQARVENARLLERLRLEEWLKTQRDVFQFASHTSTS